MLKIFVKINHSLPVNQACRMKNDQHPEAGYDFATETIQVLAAYLLDAEIERSHEEAIIDRLHERYAEMALVSGFDGADAWKNDVQASSGMAISVNEAARCLLDYRRTGQFFRGIYRAIHDARKKYPGETIEVLYAGCGPYAPFFTMVASLFSPQEVQFTLVEINGESLQVAKKLIHNMGLDPYLRECFEADATLLRLPEPLRYHILFSETMDAALEREPIISIFLNLLPQLREEIFVIPRNVIVEGVFYREQDLSRGYDGLWDLNNKDHYTPIGVIMDMNEALSTYLSLSPPPDDNIFHEMQLSLPDAAYRDYFALVTTVEIWDGLMLYKNDSDITDLRVRAFSDVPECEYINFEYALTEEPQMMFGVS